MFRIRTFFTFMALTYSSFAVCDDVTVLSEQVSSSSFSAKKANPDGSVTIFNPKYYDERSRLLYPMSAQESSSAGVCQFFGYDQWVGQAVQKKKNGIRMAIVNKEGTIQGVEKFSSKNITHKETHIIKAILCRPIEPRQDLSLLEYRSIEKDSHFEETTIKGPKVNWLGNKKSGYISAQSDLDGVCKFFGFTSHLNAKVRKKYIPLQACYLGVDSPRAHQDLETVVINSLGAISSIQQDKYYFSEVICK